MPRFPRQEVQIDALAQSMEYGLLHNLALWPAPPTSWLWMKIKRLQYTNRRKQMIAAKAAAAAAYTAQQEALKDLIAAVKKNLRYAENTVDFDDHKLKLIGWSGKRTARTAEPPGQTSLLKVNTTPNGKVKLTWQLPADGGRIDAYSIQRRCYTGTAPGRWQDIHTAVTTETVLEEQPRNESLEFRVIALNPAGRGEPSNTETITLCNKKTASGCV